MDGGKNSGSSNAYGDCTPKGCLVSPEIADEESLHQPLLQEPSDWI